MKHESNTNETIEASLHALNFILLTVVNIDILQRRDLFGLQFC
jgi:hypothetical protein